MDAIVVDRPWFPLALGVGGAGVGLLVSPPAAALLWALVAFFLGKIVQSTVRTFSANGRG
ncbi:MAG: hypothetical protein ABEI57_08445 [Halapricum sp.]